jgi:hypothetical protein
MFEPYPFGLAGGQRSDRQGVIERHPALALSRSFLDPALRTNDRRILEFDARLYSAPFVHAEQVKIDPSPRAALICHSADERSVYVRDAGSTHTLKLR